MKHLTRRNVLVGAAAASAATALTPVANSPASAAAPQATTQAPGWYRYKVGSYEVTAVTDGRNTFKLPDTFVINAKKDQVNEALLTAHMEKDMMTFPYTPIVINTGSKLIVMDTGTGEGNFERSKGVSGQFHRNLKAPGIDGNAVDMVIISHFHGDHINGLLTADNKPAFPNAESWSRRWSGNTSWMTARWASRPRPHEGRVRRARKVFDALSRKVTQYESGKEIAPGYHRRSRPTATRPATRLTWSPRAASVYVQADVTNHPALFARNPGWHAFFDQVPEHGGGDPPQGLRHAGGREDDGAGLPLSVPVGGLCREERVPAIGKSR